MTLWNISLFGKITISRENMIMPAIEARKSQELFSYLLLFGDRSHSREKLAGLFWGEYSSTVAKKYLRQTLWELQSAVGPSQQAEPLLFVDSGWVGVNKSADVWLDVVVFERAAQLTHGILGGQISPQNYHILCEAVKLYRGDLVEGLYEDWCILERERLQNIYLNLLDKLIDCCMVSQEYEDGLVYGTKILHYDRARERTHRRLMRLFHLGGNRTEALRQYDRCVSALKDELGVNPSDRTLALREQIRKDDFELYLAVEREENSSTDVKMLTSVLAHLNQLTESLLEMQRRVKENAYTVEQILKTRR
jgi:DNA-binding SARP family transcriptional activator